MAVPSVNAAPPPDSFYDAPPGFETATPGTILRSRAVTVNALQAFPIRVQAWQLQYRTTDFHGAPYTAVTTVMIPEGPAKPRPLLSYQVAIDSVTHACAPSYSLQDGKLADFTDPTGPVTAGTASVEIVAAAAALARGWALAVPDHGGADNRFFTPREPGYVVLDGIRAAEQFAPLGLAGVNTPVGMFGYSGGGIASTWAAEMQPSYAPELDIAGIAAGAPVPDLIAALKSVSGRLTGGLIPAAFAAMGKDSPAFADRLDGYLTPEGRAAVTDAAPRCVAQSVLSRPWLDIQKYLTVPLDQVIADPVIHATMVERNRGTAAPTAPMYLYDGVTEEVSPIAGVDALAGFYCSHGTPVTYRRDEFPDIPVIGTTHGTLAVLGLPGAFAWLDQQLAGTAPRPAGCDIRTVSSTLLEPGALSALGPDFVVTPLLTLLGLPIGSGH
ncbi:lipase family protein [Nocardia sp. NPDC088792]|uniref:lipase family protein n=1 Tax=Nocardia sp. NPDC088792 TaxID=3364332 RepID=UPI0037F95E93